MIRTDERYTTAITTDDLKSDTRDHAPIGDVDVLTAAGWAPARIGTALLRLASEYDSAARAGQGTRMDAALFVGRLRSLPSVRAQLAMQLAKWDAPDAYALSLALLAWWLKRVCSKCHGRGFDVVPGTARLSAKQCRACDASGEARVPGSEVGKRAAIWLDDCVQQGRQSIRQRLRPV